MGIANAVNQSGRCIGGLEHKDSRWHHPSTGARILKGAIYALQVNKIARNTTIYTRYDAGKWKLNRRVNNVACVHMDASEDRIRVDKYKRTYKHTRIHSCMHTDIKIGIQTYK